MKGIPNRQKKSVVPKKDYQRAKQEILRRRQQKSLVSRRGGRGQRSGTT